jgi:probable rRNA maturation factor
MVEADHPDSRYSIDILSLRRFLVRAQREVRLDGEVNVRITSSEEMHRLNREFRRKNKPTDVLSFPSSLNGKSELAGDIAICAEIAYANAGALGHPMEEELKVLILHGLLHLAGYDHESDHGEMARKEARLRAKLRLPVGLIERSEINGGSPLLQQGEAGLQSSGNIGAFKKRALAPAGSPALKRKDKSGHISGALKRSSPRLKVGGFHPNCAGEVAASQDKSKSANRTPARRHP